MCAESINGSAHVRLLCGAQIEPASVVPVPTQHSFRKTDWAAVVCSSQCYAYYAQLLADASGISQDGSAMFMRDVLCASAPVLESTAAISLLITAEQQR